MAIKNFSSQRTIIKRDIKRQIKLMHALNDILKSRK